MAWPCATWRWPAGRWTPAWSTSPPITFLTAAPTTPIPRTMPPIRWVPMPSQSWRANCMRRLISIAPRWFALPASSDPADSTRRAATSSSSCCVWPAPAKPSAWAKNIWRRPTMTRRSCAFLWKAVRGNFGESMLRLAGAGQPIRVVEDHVASPTYAPLLAARTIDLVDRDLDGVFHIGGGTPISWFQFARIIFQVAHLDPLLLATNEREYRTAARRPKYSALSNAKMERVGLDPLPPLQQAVELYFAARSH